MGSFCICLIVLKGCMGDNILYRELSITDVNLVPNGSLILKKTP